MEDDPIVVFCSGCDEQITAAYVYEDELVCEQCFACVSDVADDGPIDSIPETDIDMTEMEDALNEIS